jgi:hypothetical protein
VNRIAEILAARGDTDPVGTRRARALGILAQPAEALQLLIEHQHDPTDQPNESSEQEPAEHDTTFDDEPDARSEREPESDVEPDDHHSLSVAPPPASDAKAARPRVVLHFHLFDAAFGAGHPLVGARTAAR